MLLFLCLRFFFVKGLGNRLPTFLFLSFSSTGSSSLSPRSFDELFFPPLSHWCPVLSHFTTLVQRIYIYNDGIFVSSTTYSFIFHFFPKFSTSSEFNKDLPPPNFENLFNFSLPHFTDIELKTLETVYGLKRRLIEFPALLKKGYDEHLYAVTIIHKVFETKSSFHANSALRGKFNFCFLRVFCWYYQNFHFGRKAGDQAVILWSVKTFLIFPDFVRSKILNLKSFGNSYIPCL